LFCSDFCAVDRSNHPFLNSPCASSSLARSATISSPKCFSDWFRPLLWRKDRQIMTYLDVIPTFEIALYAFVTILFVITGFLNLKDLQALRQEKWTRQDTVALILRTLFFAFLLNLILIVVIIGATLTFVVILRPGVTVQQVLPLAITSLEFSFGMFLFTGVVYGLAKWKDWYDLIDTED
jgi:hypothetical protein